MSTEPTVSAAQGHGIVMRSWEDLTKRRVYLLRVWIDRDLCVYAADLPGCVSQGESIEECVANIEEAFRAIVESYERGNEPIPWERGHEKPLFHEERCITAQFAA